jgi:hypothetical protein
VRTVSDDNRSRAAIITAAYACGTVGDKGRDPASGYINSSRSFTAVSAYTCSTIIITAIPAMVSGG